MGMDARGPEPTTEDKSGGPETQISLGAESVFGSNTDECAVSGAGSIHPSSEGTTCSGTKSGAVAGAMFRIMSNDRSGHARHGRSALLTWARIRRRSSLRGCRQCSLGFQPDLMAWGVAIDLLQMAKRVGMQCEAAKHEDLSREKSLALDRIIVDD